MPSPIYYLGIVSPRDDRADRAPDEYIGTEYHSFAQMDMEQFVQQLTDARLQTGALLPMDMEHRVVPHVGRVVMLYVLDDGSMGAFGYLDDADAIQSLSSGTRFGLSASALHRKMPDGSVSRDLVAVSLVRTPWFESEHSFIKQYSEDPALVLHLFNTTYAPRTRYMHPADRQAISQCAVQNPRDPGAYSQIPAEVARHFRLPRPGNERKNGAGAPTPLYFSNLSAEHATRAVSEEEAEAILQSFVSADGTTTSLHAHIPMSTPPPATNAASDSGSEVPMDTAPTNPVPVAPAAAPAKDTSGAPVSTATGPQGAGNSKKRGRDEVTQLPEGVPKSAPAAMPAMTSAPATVPATGAESKRAATESAAAANAGIPGIDDSQFDGFVRKHLGEHYNITDETVEILRQVREKKKDAASLLKLALERDAELEQEQIAKREETLKLLEKFDPKMRKFAEASEANFAAAVQAHEFALAKARQEEEARLAEQQKQDALAARTGLTNAAFQAAMARYLGPRAQSDPAPATPAAAPVLPMPPMHSVTVNSSKPGTVHTVPTGAGTEPEAVSQKMELAGFAGMSRDSFQGTTLLVNSSKGGDGAVRHTPSFPEVHYKFVRSSFRNAHLYGRWDLNTEGSSPFLCPQKSPEKPEHFLELISNMPNASSDPSAWYGTHAYAGNTTPMSLLGKTEEELRADRDLARFVEKHVQ